MTFASWEFTEKEQEKSQILNWVNNSEEPPKIESEK